MRKVTSKIRSVDDALYFARKRVPKAIMQQFMGGSGSGHTMRRNREAFEEIEFIPRSAVFYPERDLRTTILGHEIAMPIYLSSVGALLVGHAEGELAAIHAANTAGTIQWVSGLTSTPIEEIMAHARGPVFQQLYYFNGKSDMTASVIQRAKQAGVAALVLVGDSPTRGSGLELPIKERAFAPRDMSPRSAVRFLPQLVTRPAWTWDLVRGGLSAPKAVMARRPDGTILPMSEATAASFTVPPDWSDLPWIREHWDGPIIMKGIVSVESARRAVDEGLDAIVVSNHGGNMLDCTVASIEALPAIADAVGDKIEILLDSGVIRGTDVVKALSLGARAVGLGRGYVYPLLAAGEVGITHMLALLRQQIDETLMWLGVSSIHELNPTFLRLPGERVGERVA